MSLAASESWMCEHVPEGEYYVYQGGSHADGTFIRVYVQSPPQILAQS